MQQQRRSFLEWLPVVVATSTMCSDKYNVKLNRIQFVDKKIMRTLAGCPVA